MKRSSLIIFLLSAFLLHSFSQDNGMKEPVTMNPALLVIDVQNKYLPLMSQSDQERAMEMMNWAIWVFRKHQLPIIAVYHTNEKWGPEPGTEDFEFHDSIKIEKGDARIVKTYGSAFNKTKLDSLLKANDINTLFLCGLSSVGCVLATYFDAGNYDYTRFLIKDALLSHDEEYTNQVENIFDALDLNTINYMLEIRRRPEE